MCFGGNLKLIGFFLPLSLCTVITDSYVDFFLQSIDFVAFAN
jgi:hypothetical protein